MKKEDFLGHLDPLSGEWRDGVLSSIIRENSGVHRTFVIFQGALNPEWVEALNSVLDDNRLLTLPSGERLPIGDKLRIIFETSSVENLTPATISRCGIVSFYSKDLSPKSIVNTFCRIFETQGASLAEDFCIFDKYFHRPGFGVPKLTPSEAATQNNGALGRILASCNIDAFVAQVIGNLRSPAAFVRSFMLALSTLLKEERGELLTGGIDAEEHVKSIGAYALYRAVSYFGLRPDDSTMEVARAAYGLRGLQPQNDASLGREVATLQSSLARGLACVVVGPSGSGKTELLRGIASSTSVDGGLTTDNLEVVLHRASQWSRCDEIKDLLYDRCNSRRVGHGIIELAPKSQGRQLVLFVEHVRVPDTLISLVRFNKLVFD